MEQLVRSSTAGSGQAKPERKVTSVQIAGIPVEFPFEPYECQRTYMEAVITALQRGQNALLESPTGTGKTLCLLCAALAWRESLKPQGPDPAAVAAALQQHLPATAESLHSLGLAPRGPSGGPGAAPAPEAGASSGAGPGGAPKPDLPLIIYSSRTHSQLAQVMKELKGSSYRDRVRSSVLSSRNQTCLHPTVSKLSGGAANQACKALTSARKCNWHNNLKFGKGRNSVSSLVGPVPDIEELVDVGRKHSLCPFYMGRDAGKDADIIFAPYNYLLDPNTRRTLADSVKWENAVLIFDEAHNVESVSSDSCSFDITAKQLTDAILDAKRAKEVCLNQVERGASTAMVDVPAPGNAQGPTPPNYRQLLKDMEMLQAILKAMEDALHRLSAQIPGLGQGQANGGGGGGRGGGRDDGLGSGLTRPGVFIFEFLAQPSVGIRSDNVSVLNAAMDSAIELLTDAEVEAGRAASSNRAVAGALQHVQNCLNLAFSTLEPLTNQAGAPPAHKGFRLHVHMQRSWGADKLPAPTLSFWCFIPGMAFRRLSCLRLRSFLLTSGTLSPLDSFAAELQLPFQVRLENPHIITPSQVWVGLIPTGPTGATLNSSYASRDSTAYKDELGNAIVNFARLVPDGLLVFFASYVAMDSAIGHWKTNGGPGGVGSSWERILRYKAPVVEPRDSSSFQAAIDEYRAKLDEPGSQGAVFFAVCRGKVSEGLDFSDRAGRGVVLCGIPYAVHNDPKVRLKREVLDEASRCARAAGQGGAATLSGEAWYANSAMRAVNQAMGRVIRHRWDYGAIMLADARFGQPNTRRGFSRWLRDHVQEFPSFGAATLSLTQFFRDKAGFQAPPRALPGKAAQGASAFEAVAGPGPGGAERRAAAAAAGLGAGGQSLFDSAPAAVDVSGIGAFAAGGLGGGGGGRGAAATAVAAHGKAGAALAAATATGACGGGMGPGGLLGLLQSGPQQQAAGAAAAGAAAAAAASSPPADGAGLAAALSAIVERPAPAAPSTMVAPVTGAARPQAALPPLPSTGAALQAHAQAQAGRPASRQPANPMLGMQQAAPDVVGPRHRVAQLSRQRAEDGSGNCAAAAAAPAGARPGLTTGGLTRIVLGQEQPPPPGQQQQPLERAAGAAPPATVGDAGDAEGAAAAAPGSHDAGGVAPASPAAAAAAAAAAPNPAKPAVDPKAFLARLEEELGPVHFRTFKQILAKYKAGRDVTAFADSVVELLRGPATAHLLLGVADFMPRADRAWFTNVAREHVQAAAKAAAPQPDARQQLQQPQQPASLRAPAAGQQGPRAGGAGAGAAGAAAAPRPHAGGSQQQQQQQQHLLPAKRPAPGSSQQQQHLPQSSQQPPAKAPRHALPPRPTVAAAAGSACPRAAAPFARAAPGPQQQPAACGTRPGAYGTSARSSSQQQPDAATATRQAPAAAAGPPAAAAPAAAAVAAAATGPACSLCGKRPMANAHEGPCGHVACYACWLAHIGVHYSCKSCGRQLRQRNLTKKFFM